jgi:N-acetylglutamate synthase-like GNAT family acetyltransferase
MRMAITIREARAHEIPELVPILLQAEESEPALRWSLAHLIDAVYRMDDTEQLVGAATMQWRNDPCEIMELAIVPERHRQGHGRTLVQWLIQEARARGKARLLVGTANSSIPNIAFYQRCGLRMDHVRRDYFRYYRHPVYEDGIRKRDLLVFSVDLRDAEPRHS